MKLAAGDLVRERVQAGAEDVHFPEAFVRAVLADLTSPGDVVLDPFADYGTTLVVAEQMDRVGVGVELLAERVALARAGCTAPVASSREAPRNLTQFGLEPVDLCLTSRRT